MKVSSILILILLVVSCSEIQMVYEDDKSSINPLYNKSKIKIYGLDLPYLKKYTPMYFGDSENESFNISIEIKENKIKRSVEKNQSASNIRYELRFIYTVRLITEECDVYNSVIKSSFTILPKSSGYDYGTDSSLDKKYELAITDNFNRFITSLSNVDLYTCK